MSNRGVVGVAAVSSFALLSTLSPAADVGAAERAAATVPLSDCFSSDHGGQMLTGLWLSDSVVDVRRRQRIVHVTGTATDTGGPGPAAGIKRFSVAVGEMGEDYDVSLTGTRLRQDVDGMWRGTLTIPRGIHRTEWPLSVFLSDIEDDSQWQYSTQSVIFSSDWLREHGFSHRLTLRTRPDREPPRLRSLKITPRLVDATSDQHVRIRARLTDNRSGVVSVTVRFGRLESVSIFPQLVRGTPRDGIWAASFPAALFYVKQSWPVTLTAEDRAGWLQFENTHEAVYSAADLRRAGLPSEVTMRGGPDRRPPVLSEARIDTTSVDVRTADATVTVQVRLRDTGSGVESARVRVNKQEAAMTLVEGTSKDGVWQGQVVIDRCFARNGEFVPSIWVRDFAERGEGLQGREPKIAVTARDNTRPQVRRCANNPPGVVSICFTEDVTGITNETAATHHAASAQSRLGDPPPPAIEGSWSCTDSSGAPADCETGRVRIARFTPTSVPARHVVIILNPEHTLGPTDMAGNPVTTD
jgi:hypothetical protein